MPNRLFAPSLPSELRLEVDLRHLHTQKELAACFPTISQLRPGLKNAAEWTTRALDMKADGYRVLAAWTRGTVLALAGYRVMETLNHGRSVYVDDLVTASSHRRKGLGSALLQELSAIGLEECCRRLVLDADATNAVARRFYQREGLIDALVGFVKPLD